MRKPIKHLLIIIFIIFISGSAQAVHIPKFGAIFSGGAIDAMTDIENPVYETNGIRFEITPVPEPATLLLFGAGLLFLAGTLRKFQS